MMKVVWEGKTHDPVRYGRVNGRVVIEIHTLGTHRHIGRNDDVYSVKVLGKTLPQSYRYIVDAKRAGQSAYEESTARP